MSVIVSLSPDGGLQMELPGVFGNRVIPLRETSVVKPSETIRRVLQSAAQHQIGEDGAPTRAQVLHWERHQTFPNSRCAFCAHSLQTGHSLQTDGADRHSSRQTEATATPHKSSHSFDARYAWRDLGPDAKVKRVKSGISGIKRAKSVEVVTTSISVPF